MVLHRRAEVGHVQAPAQSLRQRGLEEFDDQVLALLADVDADLVVRQGDDHAAGCVRAAAEVEIADRLRLQVAAFGEHRPGRRCRAACHDRIEHHEQRLALQLRPVGRRRLQVDDQAGALTGLDDVHRADVALVDLHGVAAQPVGRAGHVERHPGGRLDREAVGNGLQRLRKIDPHDFDATLDLARDRLHHLGPRRHRQPEAERARKDGEHPSPARRDQFLVHFDLSCSCNAAVRSIHSPAESWTISRRTTSVSSTFMIRP